MGPGLGDLVGVEERLRERFVEVSGVSSLQLPTPNCRPTCESRVDAAEQSLRVFPQVNSPSNASSGVGDLAPRGASSDAVRRALLDIMLLIGGLTEVAAGCLNFDPPVHRRAQRSAAPPPHRRRARQVSDLGWAAIQA